MGETQGQVVARKAFVAGPTSVLNWQQLDNQSSCHLSSKSGSNGKTEVQHTRWANLDLKTQEAYELAVKGLIRPMDNSPPLITAVRCLRFDPPEFQLEIQCLHETQQYLRKIVHEIGLELKTTAVCTQVRRFRDGVLVLEDALLRTQWDLPNIQRAILQVKQKVDAELESSLAHLKPGVEGERDRI